MIRLSVNVNKVATLRNSRGGEVPGVLDAVRVILAAGAGGITVHPRADQRHIRPRDVREVAALMRSASQTTDVEYNIEGDPTPEWLELVHAVLPDQATLVPVRSGELTSEAGWDEATDARAMKATVRKLKASGIRVSVFVDARVSAVEWAAGVGADRVELYTGPFAVAFAAGAGGAERIFADHVLAAERAHALGLGINAGHDLDLLNLPLYRTLPHLSEVSIGHALIARALFAGLGAVVAEYLATLRTPA
jgi:pyridoxine 5-phosphate synthase